MTLPESRRAREAAIVLERLRAHLLAALAGVARARSVPDRFARITWERDGGRHGGGDRVGTEGDALFDRATANISSVHYDDEPARALASATALSCIVHPSSPRAPSMHLHTSLTELRSGAATWRVMADLNPSNPIQRDTETFRQAVTDAAPDLAAEAFAQGDRYFFIPALGRHRGVVHFYLEALADSADAEALAERVIRSAIDTYGAILLARSGEPATDAERERQREYHTLYLLQVLTLDRGTTAGLLVHDQNDAGILGSLPSTVDVARLASWRDRHPPLLADLVDRLVAELGDGTVDHAARMRLARLSREWFRAHPDALALQARGDVPTTTVGNHGVVAAPT